MPYEDEWCLNDFRPIGLLPSFYPAITFYNSFSAVNDTIYLLVFHPIVSHMFAIVKCVRWLHYDHSHYNDGRTWKVLLRLTR